ncbi:hypothetical protein OROHE_006232 [Orobanche hederae]
METMRGNQVRFPMARSGFNEGADEFRCWRITSKLPSHHPLMAASTSTQVTITLADGFPVGAEAMRRRILDNLDLGGREFAYDGGRSIFTVAPLFQDDLVQLDAVVDNVNSAHKDGYFVIGETWFPYEGRNLNGGIASYRGHCSSFKTTQGGVTLNLDASTASIISAGTVKEFLLLHQRVAHAAEIDWVKRFLFKRETGGAETEE